MASITIMSGQKNLIFAATVANDTGATFEEEGQWITISDSPDLTISRYAFDQAFDPNGRRGGDSQLESAWRSLLLNKRGNLIRFDDFEILISDNKPQDKRPSFLLRFPDEEAKANVEQWAERAGFETLTEYILEAVKTFNEFWARQAMK